MKISFYTVNLFLTCWVWSFKSESLEEFYFRFSRKVRSLCKEDGASNDDRLITELKTWMVSNWCKRKFFSRARFIATVAKSKVSKALEEYSLSFEKTKDSVEIIRKIYDKLLIYKKDEAALKVSQTKEWYIVKRFAASTWLGR